MSETCNTLILILKYLLQRSIYEAVGKGTEVFLARKYFLLLALWVKLVTAYEQLWLFFKSLKKYVAGYLKQKPYTTVACVTNRNFKLSTSVTCQRELAALGYVAGHTL